MLSTVLSVLSRVSQTVGHGSLAGQGRTFEGTWPGKGVQRSDDAWRNCLIVLPATRFYASIEECEKYRHLKYVRTSVDKK